MANDKIQLEGTVIDCLKGGKFRVETKMGETTHEIVGILSGRLRQNHIRVLRGDTVTIEVSPYDLNNGIITWRNK